MSGVATSVMGFSAVGEIYKLINRVKECKSAASKMYDAGLAEIEGIFDTINKCKEKMSEI